MLQQHLYFNSEPFHTLLQAKQTWRWTRECISDFNEAKSLLAEAPVLLHYDPKLPLCLAGDASAYGIWDAVSHVFPVGSEHPHCLCIAYPYIQ